MTVKKDIRKKNQPHSGAEGEAPRALPVEGATRAPMIDTGWRSLIEKRESPRVDVHLPVTLRHNGKLIPATTDNISCGGMSLSAAHPSVAIGGHVEVVVDLTELERDVTLRGTVVRVDPQNSNHVAIQFVNLLSGGHSQLQCFLKKLQK